MLGAWTRPTVANAFFYECVTAGAVDAAEPAWGVTLGGDTADNAATWRCRGANVITTVASLTGRVFVGTPLKYKYGGTMYYGMCTAITSTRIVICGAPLAPNASLTELYVGCPERVVTVALGVGGSYDTGLGALAPLPQYVWQGAKAYLVSYDVRHVTDDTGAVNPYVNVGVNGVVVSASGDGVAADKGTLVDNAAWTTNSPVAIKVGSYDVNRGEVVTPWIGTQGSNTDATILSVVATFVLE